MVFNRKCEIVNDQVPVRFKSKIESTVQFSECLKYTVQQLSISLKQTLVSLCQLDDIAGHCQLRIFMSNFLQAFISLRRIEILSANFQRIIIPLSVATAFCRITDQVGVCALISLDH